MRRLFVIALAVTIGLPTVAALLLFAAAGSQAQCGGGGPAGPGSAPGIPASLLGIYDQAAGAYQLGPQGWAYLAAINYVETRFGQDLSPSSQGAIGWMQFEPGTWAQYAVSADPTKPGAPPDPYDPWDAIFAAANDLHASRTEHQAGMIGLTLSLAVEPGPSGMTVDCICPGPVNTGMTAAIPDADQTVFAERRTVLRRYGEPEEPAQMTLSLLLVAASYITGAVVVVDGG